MKDFCYKREFRVMLILISKSPKLSKMVRVCWAFAAYMVWTPGGCMCVWVWPTVCDECECSAKGRLYHCRGHITRACLTSLQTHCLSIRFLSQEEGDPCAVMGESVDGTTQMTLRALNHGTSSAHVIGGGANKMRGWRDLGWPVYVYRGVGKGVSWLRPGTSDPLHRYVFISWLTEWMPEPRMEFCVCLWFMTLSCSH